jgi:hypothetical protein
MHLVERYGVPPGISQRKVGEDVWTLRRCFDGRVTANGVAREQSGDRQDEEMPKHRNKHRAEPSARSRTGRRWLIPWTDACERWADCVGIILPFQALNQAWPRENPTSCLMTYSRSPE